MPLPQCQQHARVRAAEGDLDPILDLQVGVLAQLLHLPHKIAGHPLAEQLVVQHRGQRQLHSCDVPRHPVAGLLGPDQHIFGSQRDRLTIQLDRHRLTPAERRQLRPAQRGQQLRETGQSLAQSRAQRLEVRFEGVPHQVIELRARGDLLDVQLLADHIGEGLDCLPLGGGGAGVPQLGEWLPHPLARLLAQSVTQVHHLLRQPHACRQVRIGQRRVGDWIGTQVHALG